MIESINTKHNKLKVEIWSDIICPFCYIGKRKLEFALEKLDFRDEIEIDWKSFQLNPNLENQNRKNIYEYLAEVKGQSIEWSIQMHEHVVQMAKEVGLVYNFDKTIVANSFNAHRLIQLAKKNQKGNEAKEVLCKAYFTDGKNISDIQTLIELGSEIGIEEKIISEMFSDDSYFIEVQNDCDEAVQLRVRGVPFFVLNRKYAISGAQPVEVFTESLNKAFIEWRNE